jgi:hypothetical protein
MSIDCVSALFVCLFFRLNMSLTFHPVASISFVSGCGPPRFSSRSVSKEDEQVLQCLLHMIRLHFWGSVVLFLSLRPCLICCLFRRPTILQKNRFHQEGEVRFASAPFVHMYALDRLDVQISSVVTAGRALAKLRSQLREDILASLPASRTESIA